MMKSLFVGLILLVLGFTACKKQESSKKIGTPSDTTWRWKNEKFTLGITKDGGHFVEFMLHDRPVNPFAWRLTPDQMPEVNRPHTFRGHFLCTGRWGAPSLEEIEAGIPFNGEVNTQGWEIHEKTGNPEHSHVLMTCDLPLEKIVVQREIQIPAQAPYFYVKETFINKLPLGRIYNVVQHATVAPPYLTPETRINTNAGVGFDQATAPSALEKNAFNWPTGVLSDGTPVDLRSVKHEKGFVTTHLFPDTTDLGWVTAYSPENQLVMGYIWKINDYRWLNIWHQSKHGKPNVQGLEFGTTGLGQPYEVLLQERTSFYGNNSFIYLEALDTLRKDWICFQVPASKPFQDVGSITLEDTVLRIFDQEHDQIAEIDGVFQPFLQAKRN